LEDRSTAETVDFRTNDDRRERIRADVTVVVVTFIRADVTVVVVTWDLWVVVVVFIGITHAEALVPVRIGSKPQQTATQNTQREENFMMID
jgi:hypothetical protein